MNEDTRKERESSILAALNSAENPIGPTEIGRLSGHPYFSDYNTSSARVVPILRRLGAVRHAGGKYSKPEPK